MPLIELNQAELFHDQDRAREFLQSPSGTFLHEIGHFVAANENALVGGHLVVGRAAGAFVIHDYYLERFREVERRSFTASAGSMVELMVCNLTNPGRYTDDIAEYRRLNRDVNGRVLSYLEDFQVITIWQDEYIYRLNRFRNIIVQNYEICRRLIGSDEIPQGDVFAIPTYLLETPCLKTETDRALEGRFTQPRFEQSIAIKSYNTGRRSRKYLNNIRRIFHGNVRILNS